MQGGDQAKIAIQLNESEEFSYSAATETVGTNERATGIRKRLRNARLKDKKPLIIDQEPPANPIPIARRSARLAEPEYRNRGLKKFNPELEDHNDDLEEGGVEVKVRGVSQRPSSPPVSRSFSRKK
jgi:hypothetical protein